MGHADLRGERPGRRSAASTSCARCARSTRACRAACTCTSARARRSSRCTRRCSASTRIGRPSTDGPDRQVEALLEEVEQLPDAAARETRDGARRRRCSTSTARGSRASSPRRRRDATTARSPRRWPATSWSPTCCCCTACTPCRSRSACAGRSTRCARTSSRTAATSSCSAIEDGVVRLRLQGSCNGCPSSAVTLKLAIEDAIHKAAPDVDRIEAEGSPSRRAAGAAPDRVRLLTPRRGDGRRRPRWQTAAGRCSRGRRRAAVPAARREPYAYRPDCPACGASLATRPAGPAACPAAGTLRRARAGRCLDAPDLHRPGAAARRRRRRLKVALGVSGRSTRAWRRLAQRCRRARRGRSSTASCAARRSPSTATCSTSQRELMCACRACSMLFDRGAGRRLPARCPTGGCGSTTSSSTTSLWEELRLPVDMAFFFRSSARPGRVQAFYPSPMGPTESLLGLEAWAALEAANPVLATLAPDVEALLVNRARGARGHWIVPIDECYALVGLIRTRWRGFTGRQRGLGGDRAVLRGARPRARSRRAERQERTRWRSSGAASATSRPTRRRTSRASSRATRRQLREAGRPPARRPRDGASSRPASTPAPASRSIRGCPNLPPA